MTGAPSYRGDSKESAPSSEVGAKTEPAPPASAHLFLSPAAVPRRKNQLLAAGLAAVAVLVLAVMVTVVMLIHYGNMPNLFALFQ